MRVLVFLFPVLCFDLGDTYLFACWQAYGLGMKQAHEGPLEEVAYPSFPVGFHLVRGGSCPSTVFRILDVSQISGLFPSK